MISWKTGCSMSHHAGIEWRGHLDNPLVWLSRDDSLTVRDFCESIFVTGGVGAGKTSGSGSHFATAMLRAGFGALVLCAKREDRPLWERYLARTGRLQDLIVVSGEASCPYYCNLVAYEYAQGAADKRSIDNIVHLLDVLMELIQQGNQRQSGGGGDSAFFQQSGTQLTHSGLQIVASATGRIQLEDLMKLIQSAPERHEWVQNEAWQKSSYCYQLIERAKNSSRTPLAQRAFDMAARYWLDTFPGITERTRSGIVMTVTSAIDKLLRGVLYERFFSKTTFVPDLASQGAVILLDFNLRDYGEIGRITQVLFKYVFQRAMERRIITERTRPVVIWTDEAQCFLVSADTQFLTMSRSSRCSMFMLTQNISNLHLYLGGDQKAQHATDSLAACAGTKIFHANQGPTNEWASGLIGREWQTRYSFQSGRADFPVPLPGSGNHSTGTSDHFEFILPPAAFTQLKKGGPPDWETEAIVIQNGRIWQTNGQPFLKVAFPQHLT